MSDSPCASAAPAEVFEIVDRLTGKRATEVVYLTGMADSPMTTAALPLDGVEPLSGAVLSEDGTYRYALWRQWGAGSPMVFVMLNPSTADAEKDDPTIRRCIGFAKREGYGGIHVVNLFAYRATDPRELLRCPVDAVGPDNWTHLREAGGYVERGGICVAAWGSNSVATRLAVNAARMALRCPIYCLGQTQSGAPRHPLYVRADQPLLSYDAMAGAR